MDIKKGAGYPASALSNLAVHPFSIDGVYCASMEGFLQSLKFDKQHIQVEVCKLAGMAAKMRGKARNFAWQSRQTLWWQEKEYKRDSQEYGDLISRAYREMTLQSESFRNALLAAGDAVFSHSLGKNRKKDTVITASEFCMMLNKARDLARELKRK